MLTPNAKNDASQRWVFVGAEVIFNIRVTRIS